MTLVGRPSTPAFQGSLQRLVRRIVVVERKIIAKQDETEWGDLEDAHQPRQRVDVLAVDFDQLQWRFAVGAVAVDRRMRCLDQRRLAHAARAPQKRIVGRQAVGETARVVDQDVAHTVDAADQLDLDAIHMRHGFQQAALGRPDEAIGDRQVGRGRFATA
jgi:hypothetical protein